MIVSLVALGVSIALGVLALLAWQPIVRTHRARMERMAARSAFDSEFARVLEVIDSAFDDERLVEEARAFVRKARKPRRP